MTAGSSAGALPYGVTVSHLDPADGRPRRGLFVAVEGGDGAGKSTQVRLLREAADRAGVRCLTTRQPGGTDLGGQIRQVLLHGDHVSPRSEALLFAADKAHHVDTVVRPALARGAIVLTDRYTDSAVAYQGAGRDLGAGDVARLQDWAVGGLVPDLTVVLDVDVAEARRRSSAAPDRLESEGDGFHEAIRRHFLTIAAAHPQRYLVVDSAAPADEVAAAVRTRVASLRGAGP